MIEILLPQCCINKDELVIQRIQFAISPLHELLRSLHVLCNPRHHGIHLPWVVEIAETLTPELCSDLNYFALCYELGIPSALIPGLWQWGLTFDEEIACLKQLDHTLLLQELRLIASHLENDFIPSMAKGIEWKGIRFAKQQLLYDLELCPGEIIFRLTHFIQTYWKQVFASLWKNLHDQLVEDICLHSYELQKGNMSTFLKNISERLTWEQDRAVLNVHKPFNWHHQLQSCDAIVLLPSYFVWPHLFINVIKNGVMVTYDSSHARLEAVVPQPTERFTAICSALGEQNRLQILMLLQEHEQTTQGLAQICHMSEGTISRHLQILKQAQFVTSQQEGKYVLYRSTVNIVEFLSQLATQAERVSSESARI